MEPTVQLAPELEADIKAAVNDEGKKAEAKEDFVIRRIVEGVVKALREVDEEDDDDEDAETASGQSSPRRRRRTKRAAPTIVAVKEKTFLENLGWT